MYRSPQPIAFFFGLLHSTDPKKIVEFGLRLTLIRVSCKEDLVLLVVFAPDGLVAAAAGDSQNEDYIQFFCGEGESRSR